MLCLHVCVCVCVCIICLYHRWNAECFRCVWRYQLQRGQQVFAGFKVVQTSHDGGERPAVADAVQRSDYPVAIIVDVKHRTLLLKHTAGTGS